MSNSNVFYKCIQDNRFNYDNVVSTSETQFIEVIHKEVVLNSNPNMVNVLKAVTDAVEQYYQIQSAQPKRKCVYQHQQIRS